jgi:hypothetical protein
MRTLFAYFGIAVLAMFGGRASATPIPADESAGEASLVLSCFYECKRENPFNRHLWKEVTTLMLTSVPVDGDGEGETEVGLVFYDDDEEVIAVTGTELTPFDLDELYVCRTLFLGGARVPEKGLVEVVTFPNNGFHATYGWIKNLVGSFNGIYPNPFRGRDQEVTGIGKTECRVVPEEVRTFEEVGEAGNQAPVDVCPRFAEGTGESGPCER